MLGEYRYDNFRIVDGANDLVGVKGSGYYVSRGDPTRKARTLQRGNDGIGNGPVLRGVTDKNIMRSDALIRIS